MKKLLLLLLLSLLSIQSLADLSEHPGNPIYWHDNFGGYTGSTWPVIVMIIVFFALMPIIKKLCGLLLEILLEILPDNDSYWPMGLWIVGAILIILGVYGLVFSILMPILSSLS